MQHVAPPYYCGWLCVMSAAMALLGMYVMPCIQVLAPSGRLWGVLGVSILLMQTAWCSLGFCSISLLTEGCATAQFPL